MPSLTLKNRPAVLLAGLLTTAIGVIIVLMLRGSGFGEVSGEKQLAFAHELVTKSLYAPAVQEYLKYLAHNPLSDRKRANINYIIAGIYMDNLHDYPQALVHYLKIKNLYPGSTVEPEANKKIIACLERLGRSTDAQAALDEQAILGGKAEAKTGTVIATIGTKKITQEDLTQAIAGLPDQMRQGIKNRDDRVAFLKQYMARELIFDAAGRKGLADDPELARRAFEMKKEMMIERYVQDELGGQVRVDSADVRLYYQAHPERYLDKPQGRPLPLDQAWPRVQNDLYQERAQDAYRKIMERMLKAENVAIFDDQVK
jgi:hypothetical protein